MSETVKHVYHIGDTVTIVEPQIVVRVGYPLTLMDGITTAEEKWSAKVHEFMKLLVEPTDGDWMLNGYDSKLYSDLIKALGSYHLRTVKFGGRERAIHTQTVEELRNTSGWQVVSKRNRKTGTYSPGGMISSGWDEPDYEPPHLSNEQTHVLLSLYNDKVFDFNTQVYSDRVEIDAVNVRLQP